MSLIKGHIVFCFTQHQILCVFLNFSSGSFMNNYSAKSLLEIILCI